MCHSLRNNFPTMNFPNRLIWHLFLPYFQQTLFKISPRFPDVKDLRQFTTATAITITTPDNKKHQRKKRHSQNKRNWRGLLRPPAPIRATFGIPSSKSHHVVRGHIHSCSERMQGRRFYSLSGPIPVFVHLYCQIIFLISDQNVLASTHVLSLHSSKKTLSLSFFFNLLLDLDFYEI